MSCEHITDLKVWHNPLDFQASKLASTIHLMTVQLLGTPGVDVPKHSRSAAPGAHTGWVLQSAGATHRLWALAHPCLSLRGGQSGRLPRSPSLREPSLLWKPPSSPRFSLHRPRGDRERLPDFSVRLCLPRAPRSLGPFPPPREPLSPAGSRGGASRLAGLKETSLKCFPAWRLICSPSLCLGKLLQQPGDRREMRQ